MINELEKIPSKIKYILEQKNDIKKFQKIQKIMHFF